MFSQLQYLLVVWYLASLHVLAHSSIDMSVTDQDGNNVNVKVEAVGCFGDESSPRALNQMYFNARKLYASDGSKTSEVIKACARNAYQRGYKVVFGIQYYGECWSDKAAEIRYSLHGVSSSCEHGVGKGWANMVYRMTVLAKSPEVCNINGQEYSEGVVMKIPNDWSSNPGNAKCLKCVCSAGQAKDCQTYMYCDTGFAGWCSKWRNATGECCPVCACFHDGKVKEVDSSWVVREGVKCSECTCGADKIAKCTDQSICTCNGESIPVPGKCCPICVPTTTPQPTTFPPPETIPVTTERAPPTFPPRE